VLKTKLIFWQNSFKSLVMIKTQSLLAFLFCFGAFLSPVIAQNMLLVGGTSMIVNAGTTVIIPGTVNIDGGAVLDNNGEIHISGDFLNDGTTPSSTGELVCDGSALQQIGGSSVSQFHHLTIDNTSGVELAQSCLVDGTLQFVAGKLITQAHRVTLNAQSLQSIAGAGPASYVLGNLGVVIPTGAQSMKYEVGDVVYAPAAVSFGSVSSSGEVIISTHNGNSPDEGATLPGLDAIARVPQHWIIDAGAASYSGTSVSFEFGQTAYSGVTDDYEVWQYTSGQWTQAPAAILLTAADATADSDLNGHWVIGEEDQTIDIQEVATSTGLQAWPVPANDRVQLAWNSTESGPGVARLLNLMGQVVATERLQPDGGVLRGVFDTAGLAPGNYVAELRSGDAFATTRILVLH
jgi:hypothetical protein